MVEILGEENQFNFSGGATEAIEHARAFAYAREGVVGPVELLIGLLRTKCTDAQLILSFNGVSEEKVLRRISDLPESQIDKTQEVQQALELATDEARKNQRQLDTSYFLWALLQNRDGLVWQLLKLIDVDRDTINKEATMKLTAKYIEQRPPDFKPPFEA